MAVLLPLRSICNVGEPPELLGLIDTSLPSGNVPERPWPYLVVIGCIFDGFRLSKSLLAFGKPLEPCLGRKGWLQVSLLFLYFT
jgi:hypothetical protein